MPSPPGSDSETGQRDAARVRIPPPLVPLLVILAGVGLNRLWPIEAGVTVAPQLRYWVGGTVTAGAILFLGLWPVVLFRRSGQSELPWRPTPSIVEKGPYRFTRNPMYLQMVLICVGLAIILGNWWILFLTPLGMWLLQHLAILPEEAYLEGKFGEGYLDYKSRVRRWF